MKLALALVFIIGVFLSFYLHPIKSQPTVPTETADSYWITAQDSQFLCDTGRGKFGHLAAISPTRTVPSGLVINYKVTSEEVRLKNGRTAPSYTLTPLKKVRVIKSKSSNNKSQSR